MPNISQIEQLPATPAMFEIASRLDTHMPGWANKINADALDLERASFCILGQLFDEWLAGARALNFSPVGHPDHAEYTDVTSNNRYLDAWKDIIEACRTSAGS